MGANSLVLENFETKEMVKLRLRRVGRKKLPVYKIVAADSRAPRDGRFIESLGTYSPSVNPPQVEFIEDRVYHWLRSGAKPTDTVRSLLSSRGILLKLNLMKRGFNDARIKEEFEKWAANRDAKTQRETVTPHQKKHKKVSEKPAEDKAPETTEPSEQEVKTESAEPVNEQTAQEEKKEEQAEQS
jgi:small subunit ribosomal protein S16